MTPRLMKNINLGTIVVLGVLTALDVPAAPQPCDHPRSPSLERKLAEVAKRARYLRIWGNGSLWARDTQSPDAEQAPGLVVTDPRLIKVLLQNFRCADKTEALDTSSDTRSPENNEIHVDFMGCRGPLEFLPASIDYIRHGRGAYDLEDIGGEQVVALRPGYGSRFEAFIRMLSRRAREHKEGVTDQAFDGS